jgi:hypothetical protein
MTERTWFVVGTDSVAWLLAAVVCVLVLLVLVLLVLVLVLVLVLLMTGAGVRLPMGLVLLVPHRDGSVLAAPASKSLPPWAGLDLEPFLGEWLDRCRHRAILQRRQADECQEKGRCQTRLM